MNLSRVMLIGSVLFLALSILLAAARVGGRPAPPALACAAPSFDFGTMPAESVVRHTFMLENRGATLLSIHKVHASCGCATAKPAKDNLLPGETVPLDVRVSLKGRRGVLDLNLVVHADDPKAPYLMLNVKGYCATKGDNVKER